MRWPKTIILLILLKPLPAFCQTEYDLINAITKDFQSLSNTSISYVDKNKLDYIIETKYESFKRKTNFLVDDLSYKQQHFLPIKYTFLSDDLSFTPYSGNTAFAKFKTTDHLNPSNLLVNTIEVNTEFKPILVDNKIYLSYSNKLDSVSSLGIAINDQIKDPFFTGTFIKKLRAVTFTNNEQNGFYFSYSNGQFKDTVYLNNWTIKAINLANVEEIYVAKKTIINKEFNYQVYTSKDDFELTPLSFKLKNGDTYLIDERVQKFDYDLKYDEAIKDPLYNETVSGGCSTYNELLFNPAVKFISSECQAKKPTSNIANWSSKLEIGLPNIRLINCKDLKPLRDIQAEIMQIANEFFSKPPFNAHPHEKFQPNGTALLLKSENKKSSILTSGRYEYATYCITLSSDFSPTDGVISISINIGLADLRTRGDNDDRTPYIVILKERNPYEAKILEYKVKIIEKICQNYHNKCLTKTSTFVTINF